VAEPGAPAAPTDQPLQVLKREGRRTTYRTVKRGVTLEFTLTD
jgi:hypothetical protein